MPDAPGLELIAQEINAISEGAVTETSFEHGRATLIVAPEKVTDALRWLRDTDGQRYTFLSSLHAADYLPGVPRFAIHYELLNRDRVERLNVKALLPDPAAGNGSWPPTEPTSIAPQPGTPGSEAEDVPVDEAGGSPLPTIDSCVDIFPGAEFPEREAYDMFGIVFTGHPDLRRILMPEDYVGWPQRRDFPIGGDPVLFTHNEIDAPRWFE
ncbi:MAG TPA: NADH-quinone oxidoreductase subunit C [Solirubrobacterales bacterium]|jgi:NADH-quinone oxidoreductase subunit C|nr:NADH-quinone oxidoreductase subunit C [Solirubrobacterales bacterium]